MKTNLTNSGLDSYVDDLKSKYKYLPVAFRPSIYGGWLSNRRRIYYPIKARKKDVLALKRGYLQRHENYSLKGLAFRKGWIKIAYTQSYDKMKFNLESMSMIRRLVVSLCPRFALKTNKNLLTILQTIRFFDEVLPKLKFDIRVVDFKENEKEEPINGYIPNFLYYTENKSRFYTLKGAETYLKKLWSIANQQEWLPEELEDNIILASDYLEKLDIRIKEKPFNIFDKFIEFSLYDNLGNSVASLDIVNSDSPYKDGYLCNVFVKPEFRKNGYGSKLMAWVTSSDLNKVKLPKFLKVGCFGNGNKLNNNQLKSFYSRFGFKEILDKFKIKNKFFNFGDNNQSVMEFSYEQK